VKDERIVKSDAPSRYTLGVVYSPNEVDSQGDYSDAKEIEKACHDFTRRMQSKTKVHKRAMDLMYAVVKALDQGVAVQVGIDDIYEDIKKGPDGPLGIMHWYDGNDAGDIVENYILPCDAKMGDEVVKAGSWLMGVIWNPAYFAKIQDGTFTGYSMGGAGKRLDKSEDGADRNMFSKFSDGVQRLLKDLTSDGLGQSHIDKPLGAEKCGKCGKKKCTCAGE